MSKTKKLVLSALLLALTIVLSRFLSINTALLSIGFSYVPIALSALWLGPKYAAIISGLADLIGALLFPFGRYFVGFTISAIITGIIYGLVLYNNEKEFSNKELIIRLIIACLLVKLLIGLGLNIIWLKITSGSAFIVILSTRVIPKIVMLPIQVITLFVLVNAIKPIAKKYLFN